MQTASSHPMPPLFDCIADLELLRTWTSQDSAEFEEKQASAAVEFGKQAESLLQGVVELSQLATAQGDNIDQIEDSVASAAGKVEEGVNALADVQMHKTKLLPLKVAAGGAVVVGIASGPLWLALTGCAAGAAAASAVGATFGATSGAVCGKIARDVQNQYVSALAEVRGIPKDTPHSHPTVNDAFTWRIKAGRSWGGSGYLPGDHSLMLANIRAGGLTWKQATDRQWGPDTYVFGDLSRSHFLQVFSSNTVIKQRASTC